MGKGSGVQPQRALFLVPCSSLTPLPLSLVFEGVDEAMAETLLGTFTYDVHKEIAQTFRVQVLQKLWQNAWEEGRVVRKSLEERVQSITPARPCSPTLLAPVGRMARREQMGLCYAAGGSCPTLRAFLFLQAAQRKQQWEGDREGKQSH